MAERMSDSIALNNPQLRKLKAMAQRMDATVKLGKLGLSEAFLNGLDQELGRHELVKVRFDDFKDQKKSIAPQIAEKTNSRLVMRVGNVAVYFRRQPDPKKQKIKF